MKTETDVLHKLEAIRNGVEQIQKLFENGHVPHAKVAEARERFRALKEEIHTEYKRMATHRGRKGLSEPEAQFYKPAIDEVWASALSGTGVRWNSNPDHGWGDVLWNISSYIDTWIRNLEASRKG